MLRKRQRLVNALNQKINICYKKLRLFCQNDVEEFLAAYFHLVKIFLYDIEITGTCDI